ncbi:purine phosphorylase [Pseudomonas weihenstephanensis]|uniref:5'-methylthioadenosine/S-adenosylhomocysteine nucleosidase n=1 Tax=Pseudomonas weihenstephanensis TaxID=1608994 RepID=A0ABS1ZJY1_9PSED|nr:purine phosphorylase [Pseudomonas weihenstephanensis]MBM1196784.1 5'-methylthioadenosine/S-adenosylhomocysteine nucleosidase [Pseudomonas weihenstephanensis]
MANLENEFILIAGSISKKTEKASIDLAHDFTRAVTKSVLAAKGGLVVYLAGLPINENGDALTFDWTVAYEAEKLLAGCPPARQLKIVTSQLAMQEKMTLEQRTLIRRLSAEDFAEIFYVEDDLVTGGNIGDEQVEVATALIALGGGKGVSDRARKTRKRKLPILPFDLRLGGFSEDGEGALGLRANFFKDPLSMFPFTGEQVKGRLDSMSLQEPIYGVDKIAELATGLLQDEIEAREAARSPDLLVITAIAIELAAAKKVFGVGEHVAARFTANGVHYWPVTIQRADGPLSCAIASLGNAGNVNATAITTLLLSELKPKKVLMMGIAAGRRKKLSLGEVILSERVVYYEGAAALAGGKIAARPEVPRPGLSTQQDLNAYFATASLPDRLQEHANKLGFAMPAESKAGEVAAHLKVSPATIASGELLIRDPKLFESFQGLHDKAVVAEMEAYGVFDACEKQNVPVLVIRGISDYGDKSKDNTFHKVASEAAAIVTLDYASHGWSRRLY